MDRENEESKEIADFSGGLQVKTTEFLQQDNELDVAENARYDTIGGVKPSEGYAKTGDDLTSTTSTSTSTTSTTTSTSTSSSTSTSTSTTTTL